jgi:hypothetical protein
LIHNEK